MRFPFLVEPKLVEKPQNGEEKVRRTYPTQNRIYGIESNSEIYGDICVHEDAKYFPSKLKKLMFIISKIRKNLKQ